MVYTPPLVVIDRHSPTFLTSHQIVSLNVSNAATGLVYPTDDLFSLTKFSDYM